MPPIQLDLIPADSTVVYRAYSRPLDEDGYVQDRDFLLRPHEETLSVALSGEKALGDLDARGFAPINIGDIRKLGLDVSAKEGAGDPDLMEITGIAHDNAPGFAISLAAASGRAGKPTETPEHRKRIRALRKERKQQ